VPDSVHRRCQIDGSSDLSVRATGGREGRHAVTQLMRIAWRTVGSVLARVWADSNALHDRFAGLRRAGIDEISYQRGHRYLTVVIDHVSGRLVWAAPGHDKATRKPFSFFLGPQRCTGITHVSADGAMVLHHGGLKKCPYGCSLR